MVDPQLPEQILDYPISMNDCWYWSTVRPDFNYPDPLLSKQKL